MSLVIRSELMIVKLERKTKLRRKFHAMPNRGWKLLRSLRANWPGEWIMAPFNPVIGSVVLSSNCDCCPYLVENGDSYDHLRPMLSVRLCIGLKSSCA